MDVLGIGRHVLRKVQNQQGLRAHHHGNMGKKYHTVQEVREKAHAFWAYFFGNYCQRPNEKLRLWPGNMTIKWIYEEHFSPFCKKSFPGHDVPSQKSFERASSHGEFEDVAKRKKHHHLRCYDCSVLTAKLMTALRCGEDPTPHLEARRAHDGVVLMWRETETSVKTGGRVLPAVNLVIVMDDTESLGLPHFSNRDYKVTDDTCS